MESDLDLFVERDQELARAWFNKAENDLLTVRNNLAAEVVPADMVCFHCQLG